MRWLLWCFCLLAESYETIKHYHYQQPTCLCVKMEFVVGNISLSCGLFSLSKGDAFVHVRPAQLCTENGVSIYMCSGVEVAWLAQNSSTRV